MTLPTHRNPGEIHWDSPIVEGNPYWANGEHDDLYFRIDNNPAPDQQSYYDFRPNEGWKPSSADSSVMGHWELPNAFKTREDGLNYLKQFDLEYLSDLLVETQYGWQVATPPKTLFGIWWQDESLGKSLITFLKPNKYLQIWLGNPVGDVYQTDLSRGNAFQTAGVLFYPAKLVISLLLPSDPFAECPVMGMGYGGSQEQIWFYRFWKWIDDNCKKQGVPNPVPPISPPTDDETDYEMMINTPFGKEYEISASKLTRFLLEPK
jgi:hypothetical protein